MKKHDIRSIESALVDLPSWVALARLLEDLSQGIVVPFLGAGVSQPLGFPGWRDAVLNLGRVTDAQLGELPGDPLSLADRFRQAIPETERYHRFFQDQFGCTDDIRARLKSSELWKALAQLPCSSWITLNYDCALELALQELAGRRAVPIDWVDRPTVNQFLLGPGNRESVRCVHLHGLVPLEPATHRPGGSFVLTEQEYQQRYLRSDEDRSKLFVVFTSQVMLFIGCSLTDLDLMGVLREVKAKLGYLGHRHYALLAEPKTEREQEERNREKLRLKYGVEPIFFRNDDGRFSNLPVLLRFLTTAEQPAALPLPAEVQARIENDPHKGRWGMSPRRGGFALSLNFERGELDTSTWCKLHFIVTGPGVRCRVHLHPSFLGGSFEVPFKNGQAIWVLKAWGAFAIGVEVWGEMDTPTWLELDLAECEELPWDFRQK